MIPTIIHMLLLCVLLFASQVHGWGFLRLWRRVPPSSSSACIDVLYERVVRERACTELTKVDVTELTTGTVQCLCKEFKYDSAGCTPSRWRKRTALLTSVHTLAGSNVQMQCEWRSKRQSFATARSAIRQLEAGARDIVERTRGAAKAARGAHDATVHAHAAHMRLLDADAIWRNRIHVARAIADKGVNARQAAVQQIDDLRQSQRTTLNGLRELTSRLRQDRANAAREAAKKDSFAAYALISHAILLLMPFGCGWRQWILRLILVGVDTALVLEGAVKDAWAVRIVAIIVIFSQVLRNTHDRHDNENGHAYVFYIRPTGRIRNRVGSVKRGQPSPQAIFLARNMKQCT